MSDHPPSTPERRPADPPRADAGRPRRTRRSWVTGTLSVLGLLTLGNALTGTGTRLLAAGHDTRWVGPIINIGLACLLLGWTLVRVRGHLGGDRRSPAVPPPAWAHAIAGANEHSPVRWWRGAKWVVAAVAILAASVLIARQWPALREGLSDLRQVRLSWIRLAIYAEALSLVAFAYVQRQLLRAGGITLGLASIVEISIAGNGLRISLPGGAAWSASFTFDQLQRRGASRVLAVYVVAVAWLMSSLSLVVMFVGSVFAGGSRGLAGGLHPLAGLAGAVLVVGMGGAAVMRRSATVREAARRCVNGLPRLGRWGDRMQGWILLADPRHSGVTFNTRLYGSAFAWALVNWAADCGCLLVCVVGVTGHAHWQGVLLAYVLAQLGASLPITPGGLGVVEGALTLTLVSTGVSTPHAVAAVLLYRILSYWILVPIGWAMWGALFVQQRRGVERAAWTAPSAKT